MRDDFKILGAVALTLWGADGKLKERRKFKNLVVSTGLQLAAQALGNGTITPITDVAVGTDATAPVPGQTALLAELERTALIDTVVTGSIITYTTTFGPGIGTGALVEAGLFNAAIGGIMLSRVTFPVINKAASDTLGVTWTLTLGA